MTFLLFFLQFDWQKLRPENLFGGQILERTPAGLSIVYLIGVGVLILFLALTSLRSIRSKFAFEKDLPDEVKRRLTTTITNRSLKIWQFVFVFLAFFVFGFHVYWTYYADDYNEQFQALSYKDLRNRRTTAARLRGWMLDRTGKLGGALAYYKADKDGNINRAFGLDREIAHLMGTERGTPGLERTIYKREDDPTPESWEILTEVKRKEDQQRDVRTTIDRDLQTFVSEQLKDKKGAVVVINPQNGDLLAMYSNPSFNLSEAQTLNDYLRLEGNKRDKPLLNRATREYYVPGSTFKTFTMISAFRAGKQNSQFTSTGGGYAPFRGSRPITDANGGCEPPFGCTTLNIGQAFEASSNQYFVQMAVDLGREQLTETAQAVGIAAVEDSDAALRAGLFPGIWNASNPRVQSALAPQQSTMVTGKDISNYDLALQGMGQGYAGQMTPFQMALIAAIPANMQGKLMKPRVEADIEPQAFGQIITPQQAAQIREIMGLVTDGSGGTGRRVFANILAQGIRTGGKTGTAEKQAPVYDAKTGKLKTFKRKVKDKDGNTVEREYPEMYERTDSWYISIAPLENPQLAISVVVEGGGYGATIAAPIAANVILKARDLGLLGDKYKPQPQLPQAPKNAKPAKKRR